MGLLSITSPTCSGGAGECDRPLIDSLKFVSSFVRLRCRTPPPPCVASSPSPLRRGGSDQVAGGTPAVHIWPMSVETAANHTLRNLVGLGRAELAEEMAGFGAEPFRARQLWH